MAQKAITIYTPDSATPHIYAEDDAQIHRALIGSSGITLADNQLTCSVVNDNTVRLQSGVYCMQGYMLVVQGGTNQDLTVDSGSAGAYRHDLLVADFTRGGGDTADTFEFKIIKGTNATSAAAATDPSITQDNLITGGSHRQEVLYRITISGTEISGITRIAPYIGNVYQ